MSLVERALKKLQESRTTVPGAESHEHAALSTQPLTPLRVETAHARPSAHVDAPTRVVVVDKQTLRDEGILPPEATERQIAGQYQQIKRPLVASALGRGEERIPDGHLIMMASALPGEGKTFTSVNLALSLALEKDAEIVLVDADVAKPHVTRIFKLEGERGLLDLLSESNSSPESALFSTTVENLRILPAGKHVSTATELLASDRMREIVKQLGQGARGRRIVLFDSPPLLLSNESRALLASIGQVVLVVRAASTSHQAVDDALDAIGEGKPTSLILNQASAAPSTGYYGYGTYEQAGARA